MLRHSKLQMEIKVKKKLISFHIDNEKLLEKYKTIWAKIEDLEKFI